MSNNLSFTADEELFAELTPEEGSAVSGGATFNFRNNTKRGISFELEGVPRYLPPSNPSNPPRGISVPGKNKATVLYDEKLGEGTSLISQEVTAGPDTVWSFDLLDNNTVALYSFANLVAK